MKINIFVLKGDLNGENRSGAFLFLSGIYFNATRIVYEYLLFRKLLLGNYAILNCSLTIQSKGTKFKYTCMPFSTMITGHIHVLLASVV